MLERLWDNTSIPALSAGLRFAELRHAFLANNVANVDTPGFKAQDLPEAEFRRMLARAIDARRSGVASGLVLQSGEGIENVGGDIRISPVSSGGDPRVDGNDVSLDLELAKLSKNTMEYQILSRLLARRIAFLRQVVRERVGG